MVPSQLDALKHRKNRKYQFAVAAVALELGVKDQNQIRRVFPNPDAALRIAARASRKNIGVFGLAPFVDMAGSIGTQPHIERPPMRCLGAVDAVSFIKGENRFVALQGWIFHEESKTVPQSITFLNESGIVVGYAVTGKRRAKVVRELGFAAKFSGFKGYVLNEAMTDSLLGVAESPECSIRFSLQTS
jgi:hypothetical protein